MGLRGVVFVLLARQGVALSEAQAALIQGCTDPALLTRLCERAIAGGAAPMILGDDQSARHAGLYQPTCRRYIGPMDKPLRPDLVVLAKDTPKFMLVVEMKGERAIDRGLEQLRAYMLATRCEVGLLISPDQVYVLQDTFTDYSAASIKVVGTVATPEMLASFVRTDEPKQVGSLTLVVEEWLRRLVAANPSALPAAPAARRLVEDVISPAVFEGRILVEPRVSPSAP